MVRVTTMRPPSQLPLRFITHNIRYATNSPSPNELPWAERRSHLFSQLAFNTAGRENVFVCLQEVLHTQLLDLAAAMGPGWAHVGVGRDDGKTKGEHSPVFYRQDVWHADHTQTYWLSETPEEPSTGWDAALPRVVTAVRLRHRAAPGVAVIVMSTHLDHRGEVARRESAGVLLALATEWSVDTDGRALPVFLGGDFNSSPGEGAYEGITAPAEGPGMVDMSTLIPAERRYGYRDVTYTSFGEPNETPKWIDFLFVKDLTAQVTFRTFGVLPNKFDDEVFLSDHRTVVADVELLVAA